MIDALNSEKALRGYAILARDGLIGKIHEFYFDDEGWKIRYLIAKLGSWPLDRLVLVDVDCLAALDCKHETLTVELTREQVEAGRSIESIPPASLYRESELTAHHDWPVYWTAGNPMVSTVLPQDAPQQMGQPASGGEPGKLHLFGTRETNGYQVYARDGQVGCAGDLLIDCEAWTICCLVLDLGNWLPGKKVLLPTTEAGELRREELAVHVERSQAELENSPVLGSDPEIPSGGAPEVIIEPEEEQHESD